jgi:hypothetical protein
LRAASAAPSSDNQSQLSRAREEPLREMQSKKTEKRRRRGIFIIIPCNVAIIGEFINKKRLKRALLGHDQGAPKRSEMKETRKRKKIFNKNSPVLGREIYSKQ